MAGLRVLIVEDSQAMRELITSALQRIPEVEALDEASDGGEALRLLSKHKYSIAVVDINLPVLDGLKLIERMRTKPATKRVRIIVVTADSAVRDRQRAMELGADAYLL